MAVDATFYRKQLASLIISVLYRGRAIPFTWHILPAMATGGRIDPILQLLRLLQPALPTHMTVLIPSDRSLWRRRLWKRIRQYGGWGRRNR